LGDQYMQYQGKFPVISISFKDIVDEDYNSAYASLCNLIGHLYSEHDYLLSSTKLTKSEKSAFLSVIEEQATPARIASSLYKLSYYLFKHTGVKPWILIDEYDTPIQSGYLYGYYKPIIVLMRKLFGSSLKSNHYL